MTPAAQERSSGGGPGEGEPLAAAIGARLRAWPRRRVTLVELEALVIEARPELVTSVELGRRLSELIEAVTADGVLRAAKGTTVHRGVRLPVHLLRPAAPALPRERPGLRHPWHPALAWAAATDGPTFEQLRILDRWLTAHPDPLPAPVKERSLEIWGDEKMLDRLCRGALRGRCPEELRLVVVHPPLVVETIGPARGGLLVENATTWWSLVLAGRHHIGAGADSTIGWIAYGAGNQVAAAVPGLAAREPDSLWYFGDLDGPGLRFAADADRSARSEGLPPVQPHGGLFHLLLDTGRPQARRTVWAWPVSGLEWLGPELAGRVTTGLASTWLAQEWVGHAVLRSSRLWLAPEAT